MSSSVLLESKNLIERTLAMMPSGYALPGLDGQLLTCNAAFAKLSGRHTADLVDNDFRTQVDPADSHIVEAWLAQVKVGKVTAAQEDVLLRTWHGQILKVEVTHIQDDKGTPAGLLLVARGASETSDDMSKSEIRGGLFETSPAAFLRYNPVTDEIRLNAAAEALLGYAVGTYPCQNLKEDLKTHPPAVLTKPEAKAAAAFLGVEAGD